MARKLTKEELERCKTDFDPPGYVPPRAKKKLPSEIEKELFAAEGKPPEKKRGRGHQSPWPDGTELQRVNVFLPVETARTAKAAAVMRGVDLGVVLDELIRENIKIGYMLR